MKYLVFTWRFYNDDDDSLSCIPYDGINTHEDVIDNHIKEKHKECNVEYETEEDCAAGPSYYFIDGPIVFPTKPISGYESYA